MADDPKTTRCITCSAEFTDAEVVGVCACPKCGTTSLPLGICRDLTLTINWSELRLLANWACFWADKMFTEKDNDSRAALGAVLKRITVHRQEGWPALTLAGEVKDLQKSGIDCELIQDGEITIGSAGDAE